MKRDPQLVDRAWAAAGYIGRSRKPWLLSWSIAGTQKEARERAGRGIDEEDARRGWLSLKERGFTIVRVTITGEMPE